MNFRWRFNASEFVLIMMIETCRTSIFEQEIKCFSPSQTRWTDFRLSSNRWWGLPKQFFLFNSRWKGPRLSFKPVTLRVWGNTFNHLAALKHNHHIENQVNSGSMTKSGSVATNLFLNILANSIFEFIQCFCFLWERIFCLYRNTTEFIQTFLFFEPVKHYFVGSWANPRLRRCHIEIE